ncbi:hypothetical protein CWRG_01378 [Chthonomonas calidirosea]|uniref:NPCBM-associated, NEW3 domain of alpha-galactosidase n=1 Tax=Chthonomonas calidirosea (strain DSM 23976 / ICMP 18418 / T49) TaxID=1303518 RepID=S0EZQ2_CHTCT|nr:hypothetical protein [Chthonomonas calidirosea]CCW36486.1 hypothetical protein CCALI_02696 [Chthonomonas calidirosea T49]CEK16104.1 hypothetical protein CWRG_01378 [Chthonomonas calidirosea]CEK17195.1 hypothetical protein CTKA_01395 [Chthonomonas calidirosea]
MLPVIKHSTYKLLGISVFLMGATCFPAAQTLPGLPAQTAPSTQQTTTSSTPPTPAPGSSVDFRTRPPWPVAAHILKRTPDMNGIIQDDQWNPFYTVTSGPITGTVFCDWDDNYLYVAARTSQPATLIIDVDASDNGWLRGSDNLELVVGPAGPNQKPALVARVLDASSAKDVPFWTTQGLDVNAILTAGRLINGTQEVEVAIPKDTAGLLPTAGATIGLRVEFIPPIAPTAYTPTAPYEPHLLLDANLVNSEVQTVPGINPHLELSDYRCIAGQKLFATLFLLNQTDQTIHLRSVLWQGTGNSKNAVDTISTVTPPSLPPHKTVKFGYKTILPKDLPLGNYTLQVTATLDDGRQVSASASFTVVEPIEAHLQPYPDPLYISGTTRLDLRVVITSAVPDHFRGRLEILQYPKAWQLEGKPERSVVVYGEDATGTSHVYFNLPADTKPGDYPIEARIIWFDKTWPLHCTVHVVGNEALTPPPNKK